MNTPSSTPQFLSFKELETREIITPDLIISTLEEYVGFGSEIMASSIISLTEKCEMTLNDWMKLESQAKKGAEHHEKIRNTQEAREYRDLEAYAGSKINLSLAGEMTTDRVEQALRSDK